MKFERQTQSIVALWLVIMTFMAYPLFGTLLTFTSYSTLLVSAPIRAIVIILCGILIAKQGRSLLSLPSFWILVAIWFLYSMRLAVEYFDGNIDKAEEFAFKLFFFSIPVGLAFLINVKIDDIRLAKNVMIFGSLTSVLAIYIVNSNVISERSFIEANSGRLYLDAVNPITYGYVGSTTILAAIQYWSVIEKTYQRIYLLIIVCLACATIYYAASRGPVMALFLSVITLGIFNSRCRILLLSALTLGAAIIFVAQDFSQDNSNLFATRIANTLDANQAPEERSLIMQEALRQIIDSPIFGSSIVVTSYSAYPHNPFLEIEMAVGLLGLLLLSVIHLIAIPKIIKRLSGPSFFMSALAVQSLIGAQVSGAISQSVSMWLVLAWFSGYTFRNKELKKFINKFDYEESACGREKIKDETL